MCKRQERGIALINPNENLSKEYIESAEETLSILKDIENKSNIWLATTKYYCEYFVIYALFMKLGIKSEIHDCTIELCDFLEKENFLQKGTYIKLKNDKNLRIDNQYYLKNIIYALTYDKINVIGGKIKRI